MPTVTPRTRNGFEDLETKTLTHISCECLEGAHYVITLCGRMEPKDKEAPSQEDFELCPTCQEEVQFHTCDKEVDDD